MAPVSDDFMAREPLIARPEPEKLLRNNNNNNNKYNKYN